MSDPFVGRLTYVRVYSGVLRAGSHVENTTKERKERIGRILQMHANHREDMEAAFTGDIVAIVGLKHSSTGDTLADPANPIVLESISFPTPGDLGRGRAQDQGRPGQAGHRPGQARRRGPDVRRQVRRRDRTDRDLGDGRAPPRHHRGPSAPRVQRRRQRRQAAGGLPRDHPQARHQGRGTLHPSERRARSVRPRLSGPRAHRSGRRLRVHQQDRRRQDPARVHPGGRPGHPGGDGDRRARRLPAGGRPRHPGGRVLPRGGLVGDGVQDRRLDRAQGGRRAAPTPCCSSP